MGKCVLGPDRTRQIRIHGHALPHVSSVPDYVGSTLHESTTPEAIAEAQRRDVELAIATVGRDAGAISLAVDLPVSVVWRRIEELKPRRTKRVQV